MLGSVRDLETKFSKNSGYIKDPSILRRSESILAEKSGRVKNVVSQWYQIVDID